VVAGFKELCVWSLFPQSLQSAPRARMGNIEIRRTLVFPYGTNTSERVGPVVSAGVMGEAGISQASRHGNGRACTVMESGAASGQSHGRSVGNGAAAGNRTDKTAAVRTRATHQRAPAEKCVASGAGTCPQRQQAVAMEDKAAARGRSPKTSGATWYGEPESASPANFIVEALQSIANPNSPSGLPSIGSAYVRLPRSTTQYGRLLVVFWPDHGCAGLNFRRSTPSAKVSFLVARISALSGHGYMCGGGHDWKGGTDQLFITQGNHGKPGTARITNTTKTAAWGGYEISTRKRGPTSAYGSTSSTTSPVLQTRWTRTAPS